MKRDDAWQALFEQVQQIVVEQLNVDIDTVDAKAKFVEDLGGDSLDTVELVMALEERFGTEIPDEDAEKIGTVGEAVDYLYNKGLKP